MHSAPLCRRDFPSRRAEKLGGMNNQTLVDVTGLRAQREALGLSRQELARLADCSLSMLHLIENGYAPPRRSRVLERLTFTLSRLQTSGDSAR